MLAKGRAVAKKDRHHFPADLLKVGTGFRLADVRNAPVLPGAATRTRRTTRRGRVVVPAPMPIEPRRTRPLSEKPC